MRVNYNMVHNLHIVVVVVTALLHQTYAFPASTNDDKPLVEISHQIICQNAVKELARDTALQKRDDIFVNLVVNVCFPDMNDATVLLQLLASVSGRLPVATTEAPWENEWDFGLLPEVHSGQEGIDEDDLMNGDDDEQVPELIGGLPAELGPGQEGVDAGGNAGEDTGVVPDSTNWWDGDFVDDTNTDMDNEVDIAQPTLKQDRPLFNLVSLLLDNMFDNEVNDILSQFDNESGSSSSSSSEEKEQATTTEKVTTQSPTTNVPTDPPTTIAPTEPPTTKVATEPPTTTQVATEKLTTKAPATAPPTEGVTTGAATQPPLPSVNPNKKANDEMILELLLRYAQIMKKSDSF